MTDRQLKKNNTDTTGYLETHQIQSERYRVFAEEVADGFYETDLRGNFKYFNNALCRIFDYDRSEIQNRNFREFMDRRNAESAFKRFNQIYRSGRGITDIVWEIIRKDGRTRIIELSAKLILDDRGEKAGFRGIARDITDKTNAQLQILASEKQIQRQYRASRRAEQRYRAFLNFLPDPVFAFNLDGTVSYLNPAFEKTFGWTLAELEGKRIPFVPESEKKHTREGVERLFKEKKLQGFETRRLTRDGHMLDIVIDGAIFYDEDNQPAGQVVTLRDVTRQKRIARINQTLFRIGNALPHYQRIDGLLAFITREVQNLLEVESASAILLDDEKQEFYFFAVTHDDSETGKRFKEVRFPVDSGIAGEVFRTRQPIIVPDVYASPYFNKQVDEKVGFQTRSMLDVPIQIQDRMIGVLCAVNKKNGGFDSGDVELLSAVASTVALPIENARINQELQNSYDEVKTLNRAKDQVIHHLSHELKTPVSVLSASLGLLARKMDRQPDQGIERLLERSQRNLQRILDMQYEIEDILRKRDFSTRSMLSLLLDLCTDELEVLATEAAVEEGPIVDRIRKRIDQIFGPRVAIPVEVDLADFVSNTLQRLLPRFAHRQINIDTNIDKTAKVWIPPEILRKITVGLIRNAVENTPDSSRVELSVRTGKPGPEFEVRDYGTGITAERQRLIFENFSSATDTMQYSTGRPYDFGAGGRGFDLLRMKIFSERYNFKIRLQSKRCRFIPTDQDRCPGNVNRCEHCNASQDCLTSGGTSVVVQFPPAEEAML